MTLRDFLMRKPAKDKRPPIKVLAEHSVQPDPEDYPVQPVSIRLSLREVCQLLGLEVPPERERDAGTLIPSLSAGVLTSGQGGTHFVRNFDYDKIDTLIARGVTLFISKKPLADSQGHPVPTLIHHDPEGAFEEVCREIKSRYAVKTIAITGSIGKTTTKEMVRRVCQTTFQTLYSRGNQNGIAQVGRYVQKLTDQTEVYIQETGAAKPGLVESGARILRPDAFIVTNIGFNHVGNYGGSQDAILQDKLSHDRYLPDDGVVFINYDDPKLRAATFRHRVISYGVESRDTSYFAEGVEERDGRLEFVIVDNLEGIRTPAVVNAFGRHNVGNALVSYAVGRWLGIPVEDILIGLAGYRGEGLRQNLTELGGQKVLVDCYNASEGAVASTAKALQTISLPPGGKRILVFGDIDDKLGDLTEEIHRRVGRMIAEQPDIDLFVCFGEHAGWAGEEAARHGKSVLHTNDRAELHELLRKATAMEDVIAFKGGQQMALSLTIDTLYGSSFVLLDGDVLQKRGTHHQVDGVTYRHIDEYGVELRRLDKDFPGATLHVEREVAGMPVYLIGRRACADSALEEVSIPSPVRTLGPMAFYRSRALKSVSLPTSLVSIGPNAFAGCWELKTVVIPQGVTTVGRRAFFRCSTLERIVIPSSVKTIEEQVFSYCRKLTIECEEGSFAEKFCRTCWPQRQIAVRPANN